MGIIDLKNLTLCFSINLKKFCSVQVSVFCLFIRDLLDVTRIMELIGGYLDLNTSKMHEINR